MKEPFAGLDDFRASLRAAGFKVARSPFERDHSRVNWYAYRASSSPARECECNEGKFVQIVVYPFDYSFPRGMRPGVEIEVCGEAGGRWYKLRAYAMTPDEALASLPEVERALIAAWNALVPAGEVCA